MLRSFQSAEVNRVIAGFRNLMSNRGSNPINFDLLFKELRATLLAGNWSDLEEDEQTALSLVNVPYFGLHVASRMEPALDEYSQPII